MQPEKQRLDFGRNDVNSSRPNSRNPHPGQGGCRFLAIGLLMAARVLEAAVGETCLLSSPDGRIQVSVQMPAPGSIARPSWSATFRGKPILTACGLGLQTADAESDPNHLISETRNLSAADTLTLHLALDGGIVAQLAPAK
jgi:hypothetical protein